MLCSTNQMTTICEWMPCFWNPQEIIDVYNRMWKNYPFQEHSAFPKGSFLKRSHMKWCSIPSENQHVLSMGIGSLIPTGMFQAFSQVIRRPLTSPKPSIYASSSGPSEYLHQFCCHFSTNLPSCLHLWLCHHHQPRWVSSHQPSAGWDHLSLCLWAGPCTHRVIWGQLWTRWWMGFTIPILWR